MYATGTYALMQGQTVNKVEAKWYKEVQSNLIWAGTVQDLTPANNAYTTAQMGVDIKDQNGMTLQYTVIVNLYIVGNNNPVAYSLAQHYTP